jgi:hypothetical protein
MSQAISRLILLRMPFRAALLVAAALVGIVLSQSVPLLSGWFETQAAEEQVAMIPSLCPETRGRESEDFLRDQSDANRCWISLPNLLRHYPEMAGIIDEEGSAQVNRQAARLFRKQAATQRQITPTVEQGR